MPQPLEVRLGGYAPSDSTHGQALDRIATELRAGLGERVAVTIDHNILDSGRAIQELVGDVEAGRTTLCYFSCSYLVERVPELGIVDLPYAFSTLADAHAALDGPLGAALSRQTRRSTALVPLGYWDNGFRHLSNRYREVRTPHDCRGLRIRLQPNELHERFFRALGTEPVRTDLREGIAMLKSGELDAQENPLANFVAYGIDAVHPHVTLTGHLYGTRGVYASAAQLRGWPDDARELLAAAVAVAVAQQRADAARKEVELRRRLVDGGTRVLELTGDEQAVFRALARPVRDGARASFDGALWTLVDWGGDEA